MKLRFPFQLLFCSILSFLLLFFSFHYSSIPSTEFATIPTIQQISYDDVEIKKIRKELAQNLRKKHLTQKDIIWRKYIIKKSDSFFQILAKTMSNHDTLSSVNNLVSVYDIETGKKVANP